MHGLMLLAVALAQEPDLPTLAPPVVPLEEVWERLGPSQVLREAIDCIDYGNFDCADARLAWVRARRDDAQAAYHGARSLEFQERYEEAVVAYQDVMTRFPYAPESTDAAFRRALAFDDLGRPGEARDLLGALRARGGWDDDDRLSIELSLGVAELHAGREHRGIRRIERALPEVEGSERVRWVRAKARASLAEHLLDEAAAVEIRGNRRAARALVRRSSLMADAEAQVVAIARLQEPEHALAGLLMLGDAYVALYDDVRAAPPPRRLDAEERAIYRDLVEDRTAVLKRKAWRYYDEGVDLADRTRWQGRIASVLRSRRDALGD